MTDRITIVDYYNAKVSDEPGEGRRFLEHLSEQGVNLLAFAAFPLGENRTQLDFITERPEKLKAAAADAGVEILGPKQAFLIQGDDRIGALHTHHLTLANAGVNVYASNGVCDGFGRFGFVLWVKPEDFEQACVAFGFV